MANPVCLALLVPEAWYAFFRAWAKTGKRIAARIAMIAMTTSSSMSVKPLAFRFCLRCLITPPLVQGRLRAAAGRQCAGRMLLTLARVPLQCLGGVSRRHQLQLLAVRGAQFVHVATTL